MKIAKIGMQASLVTTTNVNFTGPPNTGESVYDPGHDLSIMELMKFREMNEDKGTEEVDAFG